MWWSECLGLVGVFVCTGSVGSEYLDVLRVGAGGGGGPSATILGVSALK